MCSLRLATRLRADPLWDAVVGVATKFGDTDAFYHPQGGATPPGDPKQPVGRALCSSSGHFHLVRVFAPSLHSSQFWWWFRCEWLRLRCVLGVARFVRRKSSAEPWRRGAKHMWPLPGRSSMVVGGCLCLPELHCCPALVVPGCRSVGEQCKSIGSLAPTVLDVCHTFVKPTCLLHANHHWNIVVPQAQYPNMSYLGMGRPGLGARAPGRG